MHKYETIFVIDSLLKSDDIDNIINKYERFISANGGQIETVERWGKKRLAYEIKKRQYGFYVLIRFDGPPTMIKPLEREYRLNESLLRYKTLHVPAIVLKNLPPQAEMEEKPEPAVEESKKAPETVAKEETPETKTEAEEEPKPESETTEEEPKPESETAEEEPKPEFAEEGAPETSENETEENKTEG